MNWKHATRAAKQLSFSLLILGFAASTFVFASDCKKLILDQDMAKFFATKYREWPVVRRDLYNSQDLLEKTVAILFADGETVRAKVIGLPRGKLKIQPLDKEITYIVGNTVAMPEQDASHFRVQKRGQSPDDGAVVSMGGPDMTKFVGQIIEKQDTVLGIRKWNVQGRLISAKHLRTVDLGTNYGPDYHDYFDLEVQLMAPRYIDAKVRSVALNQIQELRIHNSIVF